MPDTQPIDVEVVAVIAALQARQHDTTEQLIQMGDKYQRRYTRLCDLVLNLANEVDSRNLAARLHHLVHLADTEPAATGSDSSTGLRG